MNRSDCSLSLVFGFFGFGLVPAYAIKDRTLTEVLIDAELTQTTIEDAGKPAKNGHNLT
jgi:hypothetical protein